ncbi:MAG TPA: hypothetical protein VFF69_08875 [Phycisphaerales bacterium]|nr:hypothetical protein [Phycisphaerales bacterium]
MTPALLAASLAALLLGLALVAAGLRGRRLNDHPHCRKCRFDLVGLGGPAQCPECGRPLDSPRALRRGIRARSKRPLVAGAILATPSLLLLAGIGLAAARGTNLNAYKPHALLELELERGSPATASAAAAEFARRVSNGALSGPKLTPLIQFALDRQADTAAPWPVGLGDLLDAANAAGALNTAAYLAYVEHSVVVHCLARRAVAPGDLIPIAIQPIEGRAGALMADSVEFSLVESHINRVPVIPQPRDPALLEMNPGIDRNFGRWEAGFVSRLSYGPHTNLYVAADALPLGRSELHVTILARLSDGSPPPATAEGAAAIGTILEFTVPIEIVQPDQRPLRRVPPSPELAAALASQLKPELSREQGVAFQTLFQSADLPAGISHQIILRGAEREMKAGSVALAARRPDATAYGVWIGIPDVGGPTADIILRPDPERALQTIDVFEYYDGDIVIPAVAIRRE